MATLDQDDLAAIALIVSNAIDTVYSQMQGQSSSIIGNLGGQLSGLNANVTGSFSGVHAHLDSMTVDLTPIIDLLTPLQTAELNNLHEDIVSLGTQLSTVTVPLQSLNGNGSEYKDGVQVLVTGRLPVYTVSRSYMSMMDTDTYTCVYDLEAPDGSKTTCPESFLTPYVAPVVTS